MVNPNICITGDSIEAKWPYTAIPNAYSLIEAVRFQMKITFTDLAVPSTRFSHALTYWNALSAGVKSSFDYVIVSGCHNNMGSGVANYCSECMNIINQINTDKQASCKIILTTVCPGTGFTYSDYVAVNNEIKGQGGGLLTGYSHFIYEHSDYLENPGTGRLKSIYYGGGSDQLHPNDLGREIYADAIAKKLKQLGVAV